MTFLKDLGLLAARIVLAIILIFHGWGKVTGFSTYVENFAGMGVPLPSLSVGLAAAVELIGGALILIGLLTPLAGLAVFLVMLSAYFFAHMGNGVAVDGGGFELVGAIAAAALALAAAGAGLYSVDAAIGSARNRSAKTAAKAAA
ncbi:membrane protein [Corynebacterium atypicum]|uniref:Membrane protein n=1 Tax=Corynebacterium atypicum TaxID=191610 RepID=A0ABM5QLH5_9CORY|nr:DoxX family protein [Corynebacterium atypicum]AIG63613.1 membrane protein [Corynebacterium atypicum]